MRDYICPAALYTDVTADVSSTRKRAIVLRKAERERPVIRPILDEPQQDARDSNQETVPVLRRSSRFRAHDEGDESGHSYPTARYSTRFD